MPYKRARNIPASSLNSLIELSRSGHFNRCRRYKHRLKRGGDCVVRHELGHIDLVAPEPDDELLHLNEALDALETSEPIKARVVKLKFFCGMTIDEVAAATELSRATVERYWAYSRVWLQQWMERDHSEDEQQES